MGLLLKQMDTHEVKGKRRDDNTGVDPQQKNCCVTLRWAAGTLFSMATEEWGEDDNN